MINAAFIVRSTLHTVPGGDTIQVIQTAKWLKLIGVTVDILLSHERVEYQKYQLFHFFNLTRPADIISHLSYIRVPIFVSPIMVDYSEYDKNYRKGFGAMVMKIFSPATNEYLKTISRWIKGKDRLPGRKYIWMGQNKAIREILKSTTALLPNSHLEMDRIAELFDIQKPYSIVPNGIDHTLFTGGSDYERDDNLILCVGRIEGIKNQLNLIKALNDSKYTLVIIGSPAPNQLHYHASCKALAKENIVFKEWMTQEKLLAYYRKAKVHVLPSWFETCGLSSLEAAAMGCSIVITEKGFTREYFGNNADYCDPADPASIRAAVEKASQSKMDRDFQNDICINYTWERAALKTKEAYMQHLVN